MSLNGPCTIELDPANDYRLHRFEGTGSLQGQTYRMTQEYYYEGTRLVGGSWKSVRMSDGMVMGEQKVKYAVYDSVPASREFYLSAFGLPEPPQATTLSALPLAWLIGGAIAVAMAVALMLCSNCKPRGNS